MEETVICAFCGEQIDATDTYNTSIGVVCEHCLRAIESHGEEIEIYLA